MKQCLADLGPQTGTVLEFQEVRGVFALLQGGDQRVPDLRVLVNGPVVLSLARDGEGSGRADAYFEVLARGHD